jgi:hypothetical protein
MGERRRKILSNNGENIVISAGGIGENASISGGVA